MKGSESCLEIFLFAIMLLRETQTWEQLCCWGSRRNMHSGSCSLFNISLCVCESVRERKREQWWSELLYLFAVILSTFFNLYTWTPAMCLSLKTNKQKAKKPSASHFLTALLMERSDKIWLPSECRNSSHCLTVLWWATQENFKKKQKQNLPDTVVFLNQKIFFMSSMFSHFSADPSSPLIWSSIPLK